MSFSLNKFTAFPANKNTIIDLALPYDIVFIQSENIQMSKQHELSRRSTQINHYYGFYYKRLKIMKSAKVIQRL